MGGKLMSVPHSPLKAQLAITMAPTPLLPSLPSHWTVTGQHEQLHGMVNTVVFRSYPKVTIFRKAIPLWGKKSKST